MAKFEILYIVITLSFFSISFIITIEKLTISKILTLKNLRIFFDSKRLTNLLSKMFKHYNQYQLPKIT